MNKPDGQVNTGFFFLATVFYTVQVQYQFIISNVGDLKTEYIFKCKTMGRKVFSLIKYYVSEPNGPV